MLEALKQIDTEWFLWINGHHCTVLDWTMWTLSQHWCFAIVLVAAAVPLLIERFRLSPFSISISRRWWLTILAITLCFLIADQGSVHLFKETVARLRPCHALDDVYMFRTGCGGQYGFVSSHAANAFAVITFITLCRRKALTTTLLLFWGVAVCYSRIYLGKHYPGDLLCGAFFGMVIGLIVWHLTRYFEKKLHFDETK